MTTSEVIGAFERARTKRDYRLALRAAELLTRSQQLAVIDAARAARTRVGAA